MPRIIPGLPEFDLRISRVPALLILGNELKSLFQPNEQLQALLARLTQAIAENAKTVGVEQALENANGYPAKFSFDTFPTPFEQIATLSAGTVLLAYVMSGDQHAENVATSPIHEAFRGIVRSLRSMSVVALPEVLRSVAELQQYPNVSELPSVFVLGIEALAVAMTVSVLWDVLEASRDHIIGLLRKTHAQDNEKDYARQQASSERVLNTLRRRNAQQREGVERAEAEAARLREEQKMLEESRKIEVRPPAEPFTGPIEIVRSPKPPKKPFKKWL